MMCGDVFHWRSSSTLKSLTQSLTGRVRRHRSPRSAAGRRHRHEMGRRRRVNWTVTTKTKTSTRWPPTLPRPEGSEETPSSTTTTCSPGTEAATSHCSLSPQLVRHIRPVPAESLSHRVASTAALARNLDRLRGRASVSSQFVDRQRLRSPPAVSRCTSGQLFLFPVATDHVTVKCAATHAAATDWLTDHLASRPHTNRPTVAPRRDDRLNNQWNSLYIIYYCWLDWTVGLSPVDTLKWDDIMRPASRSRPATARCHVDETTLSHHPRHSPRNVTNSPSSSCSSLDSWVSVSEYWV